MILFAIELEDISYLGINLTKDELKPLQRKIINFKEDPNNGGLCQVYIKLQRNFDQNPKGRFMEDTINRF